MEVLVLWKLIYGSIGSMEVDIWKLIYGVDIWKLIYGSIGSMEVDIWKYWFYGS
jgi:hypothetical protein